MESKIPIKKAAETTKGYGMNHNPFEMVPRDRIELPTRGFSVCLGDFYGFSSCSLMLFLPLYNQYVIRVLIVSRCMFFYLICEYYSSKMVATK